MKRKLIAGLLVAAMISGTFAFAGCDAIAPAGGNSADNNQDAQQEGLDNNQGGNGPQGSQSSDNPSSGSQGSQSSNNPNSGSQGSQSGAENTAWSKDDDYHWHTEADKALHTVENGVCTVCEKEVTHTVGLEYTLVGARTRSADSGASYKVSGIGEATEADIVIPSTHNNLPVSTIGEAAFEDSGIESVVIPESVTTVEAAAFNNCTLFSNIYYYGDAVTWAQVHVDSLNNQKFINAIVYHYVEGTPNAPGHYWNFENGFCPHTINYWVGAAGTTGQIMGSTLDTYWTTLQSRPVSSGVVTSNTQYQDEYRQGRMSQVLNVEILSVNGSDVRFKTTEQVIFIGEYDQLDIEGNGENTSRPQGEWHCFGQVFADNFQQNSGKVELSSDLGEPSQCTDPNGETYYGYKFKKDVPFRGQNQRAQITYYLEVETGFENNGNIWIRFKSRNVVLDDTGYYYDAGDLYNKVDNPQIHYETWTDAYKSHAGIMQSITMVNQPRISISL